jgi:DNA-binding CsgD family transcriptional regulator
MVARTGELRELLDAWSSVAAGATAHTAVITGTAGVGKSLLVTAALDAFTPRPSTVLFGRARVHTPAPYDWLAAVLTGRETGDLPVPPAALAWLAQHPDAPAYRYAPDTLLRLAVRAVRALIGTGPALVVVEDLHDLDPASLNLIAELAAVPDLPALLLITSRPSDAAVSPMLTARTLARLAGARRVIRQHLGALSARDVAAVLAQVYPASAVTAGLAEAVWARTGGTPYLLTELIAARRGAVPESLIREPLPEHLRLLTGPTVESSRSAPWGADAPGGETDAGPAEAALLTAREREVLSCLAAGMSNKQVARSLGISIRTVTVHVSNLLRKTRSASRTEAALWAVRHEVAASPQRETVPSGG